MAEETVPTQFWIRNDKGKVWGPMAASTLGLLIPQGVFAGRLQASTDGLNFAMIGRFELLREEIPEELWGIDPSSVPKPAGAGAATAGPGVPPGAAAPGVPPGAAQAPAPGVPPGAAAQAPAPGMPPGAAKAPAPGMPPGMASRAPAPGMPPGMASRAPAPGMPPGMASRAPAPGMPPGAAARPPAPGVPPGAATRGPAPGMPPGAAQRGPGPRPGAPPGARPGASAAAAPAPTPAPDDTVFDPSALAPDDAVFDPSALAPDAAVFDPSALAPDDAALDPSALAPDAAATLPAGGDLAAVSPFRLAYLAAAGQETCRITLRSGAHTTAVSYRKGAPEHVANDDPQFDVGVWLAEQGIITAAQLQQAEGAKGNFGGSLTTAFFATGILDPGSAFGLLAQHAQDAYVQALLAEEGTFEVEPGVAPPSDAFPLGASPYELLVRAMRKVPVGVVEARLGDRLHAPVMKSNASTVPIEELRLGPQEARLYPLFDGVHTPAQLADLDGIDRATLVRVCWLLATCDFLSFGEPRVPAGAAGSRAAASPGAAEPGPPAAEPEAAPPAAEPAPPESAPSAAKAPKAAPPAPKAAEPEAPTKDWAAEQKRLEQTRSRWAKVDHFAVLGLGHSCTTDDVKRAYTEALRTYHPDRAVGAPDEVKAILGDLFESVRAANAVLSSDTKRRAYANELAAKELDLGKEDDGARSDVDLEKVRHLVKLKRFQDASTLLDEMIARNPGHAAALAWRGWLKVVRAKDRKTVRNEALGFVNRALKIDSRCGDVFLMAARIAKLYGDAGSAEKYLTKARALGIKDEL